jgi:imidazolonepropionase-like amidohydrolase
MHLTFNTVDVPAMTCRSQNQMISDAIEFGYDFLAHGFTTIRECGSYYNIGVALRDMYAKNIVMGPRVIASGRCNTPTASGNREFGELYKVFDDPADARRIVREDLENGCDFIKYMATGAVMNLGGDPGAMICTREELQALSDAAKENGTYVAAHCHGKKGIIACAEAEIGSIEHASWLDDECIETLIRHGNVTFLVPTLTVCYSMAANLISGVPAFMHERTMVLMDNLDRMLVKAYHAGVHMSWGTDSDRDTYNQFPGLEFTARKAAGFTNLELLKMATIDSAVNAHLDQEIGTVKAGKTADLICVAGKPDEDIAAMNQMPLYVFKGGRRFERD